MAFFRGYVTTRNKRCLEKFKDIENLKTYDEIKEQREFAGILDGKSILLDFDTIEQARIAYRMVTTQRLKCRVYRTNRGVHIFFRDSEKRKCGVGVKLACGLTADVKVGRNSYSILKYNGEERDIIYDTEEYEEVPKFFTPVRTNADFLHLQDGQGRNQAMFNYILTLQRHGFNIPEARECLQIINDFVLADPLPQSELRSIMRDDAFKKNILPETYQKPSFFEGKTFLFDKFAEYLKDSSHIIKINGQLHIYKDGIYIEGREKIESEMIRQIPGLNRAKRTEVLEYLNLLIDESEDVSPANYIAFKNGIYDIVKDKMLPFSEKLVLTNKINFNYNPKAQSELVENTLNKLACNDKTIRSLLEEAVGYCFYRRNELGKSFILTGNKSNGKSTFLDMVKTVLGEENVSSLDLSELSEKFQNAELFGKLANIGDDIGDEFIGNSAIFKKLATGDRIQVQRKGERPFEFNNYAKLLFSANDIPRIKDRTGAVQRRLVIIPFNATFSKSDPDYRPYIKYELRERENIEYLILLGVKGLKRVLENQAFSESDSVLKELEEYEEENNPLIGFFKEGHELDNQPTNDVYDKYLSYCNQNGFNETMSKIAFSKQVKRLLKVDIKAKAINGKVQKIFVVK